jgi:hypothetical protein
VIYLLERAQLDDENVAAYLDAVEKLFRPRAEAAGLELVACWHTPLGIGQGVEVSVITRFADWGRWDEIRKCMVLDRELVAWQEERRRLARGAQRRFLEPAPFSPLA